LGRLHQEVWIPASQITFTQRYPVRPKTVTAQDGVFRRVGRAESVSDLVLRQLADATREVAIPPWSMACAEDTAEDKQSDGTN
jgi:hypothetical protein